jgi:hypothetical protein
MIDLGDYYIITLYNVYTFSSILVLCYLYFDNRQSNITESNTVESNNTESNNYIAIV